MTHSFILPTSLCIGSPEILPILLHLLLEIPDSTATTPQRALSIYVRSRPSYRPKVKGEKRAEASLPDYGRTLIYMCRATVGLYNTRCFDGFSTNNQLRIQSGVESIIIIIIMRTSFKKAMRPGGVLIFDFPNSKKFLGKALFRPSDQRFWLTNWSA